MFDDISPNDPNLHSRLAEVEFIVSKLSRNGMLRNFSPKRPLSREDLLSWTKGLQRQMLPIVDQNVEQQVTGFKDIEMINSDALPAVVAS